MTISKELKEKALQQMVDESRIPQIIYKYRSDNEFTEKIFIDKTLWFEHPNKFNDPFDCWTNVAEPDKTKLIELIKHSDRSPVEKEMSLQGVSHFNQQMMKQDADLALSEIGVCCFSKLKDNILMWSHYSDYHKGLCLEFDILKDPEFFTLAKPVLYVSQMPKYDHFGEREKLIEKTIQPKADFWKYEEEVRIVKTNDDINNNKDQGFQFNPEALTKVIFGCKMEDSAIAKYKNLCNVSEFKHVKFSQMQQKDGGIFELDEIEL